MFKYDLLIWDSSKFSCLFSTFFYEEKLLLLPNLNFWLICLSSWRFYNIWSSFACFSSSEIHLSLTRMLILLLLMLKLFRLALTASCMTETFSFIITFVLCLRSFYSSFWLSWSIVMGTGEHLVFKVQSDLFRVCSELCWVFAFFFV